MVLWQLQDNCGLPNLWKLPKAKLLQKQSNLIDFIDWKLADPTKPYFTINGRRLKEILKGPDDWAIERG